MISEFYHRFVMRLSLVAIVIASCRSSAFEGPMLVRVLQGGSKQLLDRIVPICEFAAINDENADSVLAATRSIPRFNRRNAIQSAITAWTEGDLVNVPSFLSREVRDCREFGYIILSAIEKGAPKMFERDALARAPNGESLLLELARASLTLIEREDGGLARSLGLSISDTYTAFQENTSPAWRAELSTMIARNYITAGTRALLAEFEPLVISYIVLHSVDVRDDPNPNPAFCDQLRSWKYAIQMFTENAVVGTPTELFWMHIGTPIFKKRCPLLFGPFTQRWADFHFLARPALTMNKHITVNRGSALGDTIRVWSNDQDLLNPRNRLRVTFQGEPGIDAGGLLREWYTVLIAQIVNPYSPYFELVDGTANTYRVRQYDSDIMGAAQELDMRFIGEFLARAFLEEQPLPLTFTSSIYKYFMNGYDHAELDLSDCKEEDPETFARLQALVDMDPESEELLAIIEDMTFEYTSLEFDVVKTTPLIPNGENVPVTVNNREMYMHAVCDYKMGRAIENQMNPLIQGFHSIIPTTHLAHVFTPSELGAKLSGEQVVDAESIIANMEIGYGYNANSAPVRYLWEVLRGMTQPELREFLTFLTGSPQVPLGGFTDVPDLLGEMRRFFKVIRLNHTDQNVNGWLPVSHTCFNRLDLPAYTSSEVLKTQLLRAIRLASNSFGAA
jgi:hypothetical protein